MKTHRFIQQLLVVLVLVCIRIQSFGQYDTVHYLPPLYARSIDSMELGTSWLYLSTNESVPFHVQITEADGTVLANPLISKDLPNSRWLGTMENCKGIIDSTRLNQILTKEGLILRASKPFFANLRHKAGNQGMSISCKGQSAMGTRFRSGHLYTANSSSEDGVYKSHMISVMATEDNTIVQFKDFKPGVIFHGTSSSNSTTNDITVVLNKYESYVIGTHLNEPMNYGNDTLVNGVLIESSKPIVMNTGSWTGGSNQTYSKPSRDIGMDQAVPVIMTGKEYILTRRSDYLVSENERPTIVADEDGTEIYLNGNNTPEVILNGGGFYIVPPGFFDLNGLMHVRSNKNIYIYQSVNASNDSPYNQALNLIPPLSCSGINETTIPNTDQFNSDRVQIDIITKHGSSVEIGGQIITVQPLHVSSNANYDIYRITNQTGTIHVKSDSPIQVNLTIKAAARGFSSCVAGFTGIIAPPTVYSSTPYGGDRIKEGCYPGYFIIKKPLALSDIDVTYDLIFDGSAANGIDYGLQGNSVFIPAGQLQDTIIINALEDQEMEASEFIRLRVHSDFICSYDDDPEAKLFIDPDGQVNISGVGGEHCAPYNAEFNYEQNMSCGAIYHWDFGDGTTSNSSNPVHTYSVPGNYSISLTLITDEVCADTIAMYIPDYIKINPTPIAGFYIENEDIDICHSEVQFTNEAIDAQNVQYFFDDGIANSTEENPSHLYRESGSHRPIQIVTNEFGCTDSAYAQIYIEPFNVFVPNAFTPDGNEFNNTFQAVIDYELFEYNLMIYNRWGEIVFETNDIAYGWDGTTPTGDLAPTDTYQWVLTYVSCEPVNPRNIMKGMVSLLR